MKKQKLEERDRRASKAVFVIDYQLDLHWYINVALRKLLVSIYKALGYKLVGVCCDTNSFLLKITQSPVELVIF